MENKHPKPVEDYTTANLILILVNLFWIFGLIWSYWGIVPVILVGVFLNHMITRYLAVRAHRTAARATPDAVTDADQAPKDSA